MAGTCLVQVCRPGEGPENCASTSPLGCECRVGLWDVLERTQAEIERDRDLYCQDLDARAKNECYRATFRLPRDERLDGHTSCTLWTPFNKLHIPGQMFISNNYICFASKEEDACHLIIPLREVSIPWLRGQGLSSPKGSVGSGTSLSCSAVAH
ncbi:hypothetical protein P7K49_005312 [Saguinus oedipus]|uniref:GRAM domain-containing protein n=1 Tax=Saguinus oedipus TaxID=9490 RepID=A0ABQ9WAF1_SAGOE|nr:hypothetical protein P7K49_005312 [Saguinus oedipus]